MLYGLYFVLCKLQHILMQKFKHEFQLLITTPSAQNGERFADQRRIYREWTWKYVQINETIVLANPWNLIPKNVYEIINYMTLLTTDICLWDKAMYIPFGKL